MLWSNFKLVLNLQNFSFIILFFVDLNFDGIDVGILKGCVFCIKERLIFL